MLYFCREDNDAVFYNYTSYHIDYCKQKLCKSMCVKFN